MCQPTSAVPLAQLFPHSFLYYTPLSHLPPPSLSLFHLSFFPTRLSIVFPVLSVEYLGPLFFPPFTLPHFVIVALIMVGILAGATFCSLRARANTHARTHACRTHMPKWIWRRRFASDRYSHDGFYTKDRKVGRGGGEKLYFTMRVPPGGTFIKNCLSFLSFFTLSPRKSCEKNAAFYSYFISFRQDKEIASLLHKDSLNIPSSNFIYCSISFLLL